MIPTSMLAACHEALKDEMLANENIVIFGADFCDVRDSLPESVRSRYFDLGIAEQTLVGAASGMCDNGVIPVAYGFCSFLSYRAYEFIRTDICMQKKNVKLIGVGAGVDFCFAGPTHHATEDIAALRALPGLGIMYPATPAEAYEAVRCMFTVDSPVYIRLGREKDKEFHKDDYHMEYGKAELIKEGGDILLISSGPISYDVFQAALELEKSSIQAAVLHLPTIKPFDENAVAEQSTRTGCVLTIDEHSINGGIGSAVAEVIAERNINAVYKRIGLKDSFADGYGYRSDVREKNGFGIHDIVNECRLLLEKKHGEIGK